MNYDIVIVGAGPAGLSFAKCLADQDLKIALIEKQPLETIQKPDYDGREIALTHLSHKIMVEVGMWELIPEKEISLIKDAKVMNGASPYALHFDHTQTGRDNLGFMVSNQAIRKAAYAAASACSNIHFLPETAVTDLATDNDHAIVTCDNGKTLTARLAVAADSRFSATRRMMGVGTDMLDFGRTCIVCTMDTEKPHDQTAYEMFHYGRTLAVLPLQDRRVSIVITLGTEDSTEVMAMMPDDFARDIEGRIDHCLGTMRLSSKLYPYPLVATYAKQFYARRFALMGDAAVGMHPVTAHGFNLGLRGARTLADELIKTIKTGGDIGSELPLRRYSAAHRHASRPIYLGTNALVRLYTDESRLARLARAALLHVGNSFGPARRLIMDQLTEIKVA